MSPEAQFLVCFCLVLIAIALFLLASELAPLHIVWVNR